MLKTLSIKNFLLIEKEVINFDEKFSVITGETGAGKSLILDSLLFVFGSKVSRIIRKGADSCSVTAEFTKIIENEKLINLLNEINIDFEDQLIIRRNIDLEGKSKFYLNDTSVTISTIKKILPNILQIYSQHHQNNLLDSAYYMEIVDNFANNKELKLKTKNLYYQYTKTLEKFEQIKKEIQIYCKEKEYLDFSVNEIENLKLVPEEEEQLTNTRIALLNQEKLIDTIENAINHLEKNETVTSIINAQKILIRNNNFDHVRFDPIIESLEKASIELEDSIHNLKQKQYDIANNNNNLSLDMVEERLFELKAMAKKYALSSSDMLPEILEKNKKKLNLLNNNHDILKITEKELNDIKIKYLEVADDLSNSRNIAGKLLEEKIILQLKELKMPNVKFSVSLIKDNDKISIDGFDKINFLMSPNPGISLSPLSISASGGELSRLMLAICLVLSDKNLNVTILFDEIDTGIGGSVAEAIGNKLSELSKNTQTICITHQPLVASKSKHHIHVFKNQTSEDTTTNIKILTKNEQIQEIAAMLSGEVVMKEAIITAKKLLNF